MHGRAYAQPLLFATTNRGRLLQRARANHRYDNPPCSRSDDRGFRLRIIAPLCHHTRKSLFRDLARQVWKNDVNDCTATRYTSLTRKPQGDSTMAPDLFRRWLDMLFWWLPSSGSANQDSNTAQNTPRQTATTQSSATSQSAGTGGASSADARPSGDEAESAVSATPKAERPADDLTAIKGIGPAMAGRLRDMGIETFDDLAATNIKDITRRLREHSVVISEKKVEGWVQAARAQR